MADGSIARSAGDGASTSGQMAWVATQAQLYDQDTTAPALVCNNFVASVCMIGDVLANPSMYLQMDGANAVVRYPHQTVGTDEIMAVGVAFSAATVAAANRDYVLALRDVLREQKALRLPVSGGRTAGLNPWFLGGLIIVVAGVVTYLGTDAIRANESIRREHMQIAQAASDRAEGLRMFRQTGVLPPPSATETAVAAAITTRAAREAARTTPFNTLIDAAARGAQTGLSYGIPLAIVGVILLMMLKKKG